MDILAHSLWAGIGVAMLGRRRPISARTAAVTVALAALPDVIHLLPILAWWALGSGSWATVRAYAIALPGQEPALPATVLLLSHHLHCILHSAVVAAAVSLLVWGLLRAWWLPLLGWWSHIVIDVFTHSADYYAVPVLYPFTQRGFDGIAWNQPWMLVLNYAAILAATVWLWRSRRPALAAASQPSSARGR